jgi:putative intracellular protease/amidase
MSLVSLGPKRSSLSAARPSRSACRTNPRERAGKYTLADQPFDTYVVEDGRLITGQNPGSAKAVAAGAVVKQLS